LILRQARMQRTMAKFVVAENARARDPGALLRAARGIGVPLFTNRHALPDDPQIQGV
jgi:hypothetical protein